MVQTTDSDPEGMADVNPIDDPITRSPVMRQSNRDMARRLTRQTA